MPKSLLDLMMELKRSCLAGEKQIRTICQVSLAEYKGIVEMNIKESVTCNVLSEKMGLSPSRSSRIIDSLVKRGYFKRSTNPQDRRSFVISLSSDGLKVRQRIEKERSHYEHKIKERFSQKEITLIKEALDFMTEIFK